MSRERELAEAMRRASAEFHNNKSPLVPFEVAASRHEWLAIADAVLRLIKTWETVE